MFGFFAFPFGLFVWILPFILIGLGIKLIRHIYHSSSQNYENHYDYLDNTSSMHDYKLGAEDQLAPGSYKSGEWESKIFQIAYKMKGRLTLSDIVLETGLGLKEAEQIIEQMVDGTHVRMEVEEDGIIVYEFPEIIARFKKDDNETEE